MRLQQESSSTASCPLLWPQTRSTRASFSRCGHTARCLAQSAIRALVVVVIVVVVFVTGLFLWGGVISPTPNPQVLGPGAGYRLVRPLRPTQLG